MARSRSFSASQQPESIVAIVQVRRIKHLAEVAVPLVFPTLGDNHGFHPVDAGALTLFGRLMQVALRQELPAPIQEVACLPRVVRSRLDVWRGQRYSSGRRCAAGCALSPKHHRLSAHLYRGISVSNAWRGLLKFTCPRKRTVGTLPT